MPRNREGVTNEPDNCFRDRKPFYTVVARHVACRLRIYNYARVNHDRNELGERTRKRRGAVAENAFAGR